MDVKTILAQLRQERDAIDAAITHLERLDGPVHRGPGRPAGVSSKAQVNGVDSSYRHLAAPTPGEE
jgi:hypothetical protein